MSVSTVARRTPACREDSRSFRRMPGPDDSLHGPLDAGRLALPLCVQCGEIVVVLSGDTRFAQNLIENAAGADLIIHEVAYFSPELVERSDKIRNVLAHHTTPQEAGKVFSAVKPHVAVYSRVTGPLSPEEITNMTRETYNGPLTTGQDLMRPELTDGKVEVFTKQ